MTLPRKIKTLRITGVILLVLQLFSYLGNKGLPAEPHTDQTELIGYYIGYNLLFFIAIILFIIAYSLNRKLKKQQQEETIESIGKHLPLVILFSFTSLLSFGQSFSDTILLIDKIMDRYKPAMPGCQLAISRNGITIFSKAYGMADLEHAVPLTTTSVTEAGSVSKQFTAAAILLLEQQGKLSLDDDVHKYIPELPDYGFTITLRNMMQHTSGLKDWGSVAAITGWPRSSKTYNNTDALQIICRQKTLNHPPGEEYLYSNSNYNLFAIIVERLSGKSLADFSKEYLFIPAGMTHTEWRNDFRKVVRNRAIAYSAKNFMYYTDMPNENVYGNGGLLTTAEDLLAWNNYYLSGKLGQPSLLARQLATSKFNNGSMGHYGAGLRVDSVLGRKIITHSGATASYRANLDYFPDLGLSIAWLSNTSQFDIDAKPAAVSIRNLLVKNLAAAEKPAASKQVIPDSALFRDAKDGDVKMLPVKNGQAFNPPAGNWSQVAAAITTPAYMQEFTGSYYSFDADLTISLQVKEGKVQLYVNASTIHLLSPSCKDGFSMPYGGNVFFPRDSSQQITGCSISVSRARNVPFVRVK